jgi:hypothetical protein
MKPMKTPRNVLFAGALALAPAAAALAPGADLQPMVLDDLQGQLRVEQEVPCDDDVDQTTPVSGGILEISPASGFEAPSGRIFTLGRANVTFAPFSIHRSCLGFGETRSYSEVGVQLNRAVTFRAAPSSPGVYAVTIAKEEFFLYEAAVVNGDLETGYRQPSEDVTGTIDLNALTVTMRVVIATRIHFEAGCVPHLGCAIDEDGDGTLTATIIGRIKLPDNDGDGVADPGDNCPFVANAGQAPVATPFVRAPADQTVASCLAGAFGVALAVDVCHGRPVTVTHDASGPLAVGANTITWTALDAERRAAAATQTVTVVDTTAPLFESVPAAVSMDDCGPASLGLPLAVDDCGGTPALASDAPPSFPVGTTVVTWTATDASGNAANATQNVTVTDRAAPAVTCGAVGPTGHAFRVLAADGCTADPAIRLGPYVLKNGERIRIEETGGPGVRLINVMGKNRMRHFHVGRGEAVITATDASNNVGSAYCR